MFNLKSLIIRILLVSCLISFSGCSYWGFWRIDPLDVRIRSDRIFSPEDEQKILSKARLEWSSDLRIRVLYVKGTPYERGYQQGALLRREIQDNFNFLYKSAISKFHFPELFDEAYERARPYIPAEYVEEMHGLAHGSKLPLSVIHAMHILPEIGEWGGKKKIKQVVKTMMSASGADLFGTSCSNFNVGGTATSGQDFYTVRILDWGLHRISKLHKYPLITVIRPDKGLASVNIGWAGFLGAISGMNEKGITLGEMGYGDTPEETLSGKPMPFLLRDIMTNAADLGQVRSIIQSSQPTNSFVYLMSDGKAKRAELYIRDPLRFEVYQAGQLVKDKNDTLPPIADTVYGGHYQDVMANLLSKNHGQITADQIRRELIPAMAMPSNFQNVLYDPVHLKFWVSNAKSSEERAAEQPYTYFDFGKALAEFP